MSNSGETVLIAEDDEMMRSAIQKFLELNGYHIVSTSNGQEALRAFTELGGSISAVFSDLEMPILNGIELSKKITSIDPSAKVILTSGNLHPGLTEELQKAGVRYFIPKPYHPEEVLETIQRLCKEGQ
ncbi:MAG: response regulator [Ignavibacteriales bacterium]|nr:response regulator [Ignavibacteriales bacterium]